MSNNSTLPIIAVGALGLSSVSCVISSLTGFLVLGDSNVESNASTDTSNTNTDTSNTSTDTSNTSTDTSNTSTETFKTIPHQIGLGADGWCIGTDSVHQDVPGCGRICSSAINIGSKRDGTWGPWADNSTVASTCTGAKLDEIWELQDDGTRKLADVYTLPFEYEFTVKIADNHTSHDAHIHFVELYDYDYNLIKRVTNNDIEFHKRPDHAGNTIDYLGAWKQGSAPKNTKLFTIKSAKAVGRLHIMYGRPCYVPGWIIKENGENIWEDKENGGPDLEPKHLTYSYDIKKQTPRKLA